MKIDLPEIQTNMKKFLQIYFFTCLMANVIIAQPIFTKIISGEVVNTPADSRSINWVDVNGDGWDDLFISNGLDGGQNNLLYINNKNGSFTSVKNNPIVQDNGPSDGATFADIDNDGDLDGFVVTWYGAKNFFYRNAGDGSFTYEASSLTGNIGTYSETAAWGDYDNDGLVDIYITNSAGQKENMLYHNLGNGNFERITSGALVTESDLSRGASWTDYDNDGDQDLFVVNESNQNNDLFRNNGNGQFSKIINIALTSNGGNSMSASWGDVDNDGDLDVFIANAGYFQEENNKLFLNNGNGGFSEVTSGALVSDGGCSYGSAFGDVDNDGDLDLVVANGYCNGVIKNFLYINDGQGNFQRADESFETPCSFGLAFSDYNNDGFLDLAIATCKNGNNSSQPDNLLYQNNGNQNNWLKIKLEGNTSNRAAIGAKVRVKAMVNGQPVWQMREVTAQSGYCGQNSLVQHIGIGNAAKADSVIVEWLGGDKQVIGAVFANQQIYVLQGSEVTGTEESPFAILDLRIAPNPIKNKFTLEGSLVKGIDNLQVMLLDTLGKTVYTGQLRNLPEGTLSQSIDIGKQLPNGIYYLRLAVENEVKSIKVVVEN